MVKKILLTLFFLCCARIELFSYQPEPFALLTIPKSGSHLLIKTLFNMTQLTPYWHIDPPLVNEPFEEAHFPYTHFCLSPALWKYYSSTPLKQFVGVRDLRDVCVSIVYQIRTGIWPEFMDNPRKLKKFKKLSFDEQLLFVIQQEYEIAVPRPNVQLGIREVANQAMEFIQNRNVLICRFEDLVGPEGGGNENAQKKLLQKIGSHIGLSFTPQEIDDFAARLYGNRENPFGHGNFSDYQSTFREGKIGSWKTAFNETHKKVFKERLGKALITLGYEIDDHW